VEHRQATEIYVAPEDSAGARDGEKVLVRLLPGESFGVYPRGRVELRITAEGSLQSDFEVIAAEFAFPIEHPAGGPGRGRRAARPHRGARRGRAEARAGRPA
jgi:hypothetical protein